MIVFRLSKSEYARDLSGKGAELYGGRWNSKGTALIYTAETRALCMAEIAVHIPLGILPRDYKLIALEFPDATKILIPESKNIPVDWNMIPYAHSTQDLGDRFVASNKYLVMKVPSVIVEREFNYLINPKHKDIASVKIRSVSPFTFDDRLFKKE